MDKHTQRKKFLEARFALTSAQRAAFSRDICERLLRIPEIQAAEIILSYLALPDEVDLSIFHFWAAGEGKTLAFPVSRADGVMDAFVPTETNALEIGRFGIREPRPDRSFLLRPENLEAVIIPCVAFDTTGCRLGRGAGYYDRYLPRCPQALPVGAAFEVQRALSLPRGTHDMPMAIVVTEEQTYRSLLSSKSNDP